MSRKKISEYAAKKLLSTLLDVPYTGISLTSSNKQSILARLPSSHLYVLKVDEGVKGRMKKGLVALKQKKSSLLKLMQQWEKNGYTHFLIEPFVEHAAQDERYFSVQRVREGIRVLYAPVGGIDIEAHQDSIIQRMITSAEDSMAVAKMLGVEHEVIEKLLFFFDTQYLSFLEINPLVIIHNKPFLLDAAVEVDSVASFFVKDSWTPADFVESTHAKRSAEEQTVEALSEQSQAAFTLTVLNPNGSIFMLLSGGGASIVLADEVHQLGFGEELANYGEYSGNPTAEETYVYTKALLKLLLKSQAPHKVLLIAGGVANFTDVRITFRGIIKALDEYKKELQQQQVKVFVRRGGPNQEEGLSLLKSFLEKEGLYGNVSGPDLVLTDIVQQALPFLK